MFNDIILWTLVSIIFLGAFTVAFIAISDPLAVDDSKDHPATTPLWAMLGTFDVHEVGGWNHHIGEPMLFTYVVISQIILVNLLIAMMGHTFGAIKERADEEWKFGRLRSVLEATERMSPLPPPLNLPLTLLSFAKTVVLPTLGCVEEKAEEPLDLAKLSEAKKAKQKVARQTRTLPC